MPPLMTDTRLSPERLRRESEAVGLAYDPEIPDSTWAWLSGGGFAALAPKHAENLVYGAWGGREVQAFDLWCGYGPGAKAYACSATATSLSLPRTSIWGRGLWMKLRATLSKHPTPGGRQFGRIFLVQSSDAAFPASLLSGPVPEWLMATRPHWPWAEAPWLWDTLGRVRWGYEIDRSFVLYFQGHTMGGAWPTLEDLLNPVVRFAGLLERTPGLGASWSSQASSMTTPGGG